MADPVRFQHFEVPLREDGSLFELGRGAMGITYKAFDTNLRCFVALKVINGAYLTSDVARQRFLREARAAAALRHPNVATVFHLGEEDGNCFYAMEFVDGETVEAMMKRDGATPPATALQIVLQVTRALGAAQKQGLVHRDIKPANLMLVREDEDEEFTVKVIDFGLAKSTGPGQENSAAITISGFLGTPHFASPEQLEERDLDVRSDIYSLGVTLYYMLAGRAPFSGSLAQVMSQHLHREPPLALLSEQSPQVLDLLRHMLAKDPGARPQTPLELRREVEACLAAAPAAGAASSPPAHASPAPPAVAADFETQALEEAPDTGPVELAAGAVLGGRYRILREVQASDFGRVFQAEMLETSAPVALLALDSSMLASAEAYTRIEDQVTALLRIESPALRKVLSLERIGHITFLSLEWLEGPSLLDLMRARKALPLSEAITILRALASGFDALQAAGISCPDISAHEVLLPGADLSLPVPADVEVKFNPLSSDGCGAVPEATLVVSAFALAREGGAFSSNESRAFVYALAAVAYELLGGIRSGTSSGSPVPIAGLTEAANSALRRALNPSASFPACAIFLDVLDGHEMPEEPEAARAEEIPEPEWPSAPPSVIIPPVLHRPADRPRVSVFRVPAFWLAAGSALVLLVSMAAFLFVRAPAPPPQAAPSSSVPQASATPVPATAPAPTPDPVIAALNRILQSSSDDPASTLAALLALERESPGRQDVHKGMEEWLVALRKKLPSLSPGDRSALRNPLELAADGGFPDAAILLGKLAAESDPAGAYQWFLKAANQESVYAMVEVGQILATGQAASDRAAAAKWFQRAADLQYPTAMSLLGECALYGNGVEKDPARAVQLLTAAAAKNNAYAMRLLGDLYKGGLPGVLAQSFPEAFRMYSSAKDLGMLDAQGNLGVLYINAQGVPKDEAQAVKLWKSGAEQGNPLCMFYYAMAMEDGIGGIPADIEGAKTWCARAARAKNAQAIEWCKKHSLTLGPP